VQPKDSERDVINTWINSPGLNGGDWEFAGRDLAAIPTAVYEAIHTKDLMILAENRGENDALTDFICGPALDAFHAMWKGHKVDWMRRPCKAVLILIAAMLWGHRAVGPSEPGKPYVVLFQRRSPACHNCNHYSNILFDTIELDYHLECCKEYGSKARHHMRFHDGVFFGAGLGNGSPSCGNIRSHSSVSAISHRSIESISNSVLGLRVYKSFLSGARMRTSNY
jgi:hypothetical protein